LLFGVLFFRDIISEMFLIFSLIFSEWIDIVIPGTDMIIEVEEQMIVVEEEVIAGNAQEVIIG